MPCIIYGMWGLFVFAPLFAEHVQPWLIQARWAISRSSAAGSPGPPIGIGILTAGIVLALMVIPFIASVMRDVFETVPPALKESAYGVGCTTWEVVTRTSCCPTPASASSAASCSASAARSAKRWRSPSSSATPTASSAVLFAPGTTIASTLANEFGEADPRPAYFVAVRARAWCCSSSPSSCWPCRSWSDQARHRASEADEQAVSEAPAMNALSARRMLINRIGMALSMVAMAFGLAVLVWILWTLFDNGFSALELGLLHAVTRRRRAARAAACATPSSAA